MERFGPAPARFALAALLALGAVACGSPQDARHPDDAVATEVPGRLEPTSAAERQVLTSLDQWKPDTAQKVGADTVVAERPYLAASGQQCRNVRFSQASRLACRDDQGWYFVPDVFGNDPGPTAGVTDAPPAPAQPAPAAQAGTGP
ncbi:MAG TPA: hypothetical protein VLC09_10230 [Polyangiaceae bacterium]|nr:hypothetical protein [Polyangiaceae bacterium]